MKKKTKGRPTSKQHLESGSLGPLWVKTEADDGDDDGVGSIDGGGVADRSRFKGQIGGQKRQRSNDGFQAQAETVRQARGTLPAPEYQQSV